VDRPGHVQHRVDKQGRLIRVDPLLSWTRDDGRRCMAERKLPHHPRLRRRNKVRPWPEQTTVPPTYHF
jgi:3'-phosphoadenosine 5'-phosphosulfate sulfotransferase (PAPS reductase)/FAD synthetase